MSDKMVNKDQIRMYFGRLASYEVYCCTHKNPTIKGFRKWSKKNHSFLWSKKTEELFYE